MKPKTTSFHNRNPSWGRKQQENTSKRPSSAITHKKSVPMADKSNKNTYCAQLRHEGPYREKDLRMRANHVAFSPVEIIHEVNEDVNSSYQSSTEFN